MATSVRRDCAQEGMTLRSVIVAIGSKRNSAVAWATLGAGYSTSAFSPAPAVAGGCRSSPRCPGDARRLGSEAGDPQGRPHVAYSGRPAREPGEQPLSVSYAFAAPEGDFAQEAQIAELGQVDVGLARAWPTGSCLHDASGAPFHTSLLERSQN